MPPHQKYFFQRTSLADGRPPIARTTTIMTLTKIKRVVFGYSTTTVPIMTTMMTTTTVYQVSYITL